jgi:GTP-binding protein
MADIPGIIEGASEGKGLGLRFLRHIERNSTLLFLVSADTTDIFAEYKILLGELKKYNPELLDKKRILGISKSDLIDDELQELISKDLNKRLKGKNRIPYMFFSSHRKDHLQELKDLIWENIHGE